MTAALAVGVLGAVGTYLLLQRGLVRMVIGFVVLQHAVNLLLVTLRGGQGVPIVPLPADPADPVGQAFALTAIVIGLGTTLVLLALALRRAQTRDEDDVEGER